MVIFMINKPFVYNNERNFTDLGGGVKRKVLAYGDDMMLVEVHFEEGAEGAAHTHPHSQTTYVLEGEFEFTVSGKTAVVNKGDMVYMTPNALHGCICRKKGILLDCFSPYREDFLD